MFDMIVGTSTGAIIAGFAGMHMVPMLIDGLGLKQQPMAELENLYTSLCKQIFVHHSHTVMTTTTTTTIQQCVSRIIND